MNSVVVRGVAMSRNPPPLPHTNHLKLPIASYKPAAHGLATTLIHRAKPINLPSNATVAIRGRLSALTLTTIGELSIILFNSFGQNYLLIKKLCVLGILCSLGINRMLPAATARGHNSRGQ